MAPFKKPGVVPNKKIRDLIEGLDIAMLATVGAESSLVTRPVPMTDKSFDGGFWIFIDRLSPLVEAAAKGSNYSLHFSSEADKRFLSIEGQVKVVTDKKTKNKFWNDDLLHWFSDGVSDPDLVMLRMTVTKATYWDSSLREMVELDIHVEPEPTAQMSLATSATVLTQLKSSSERAPLPTPQLA